MDYHLQLGQRHSSKHNLYCFSNEIIAVDVFLTTVVGGDSGGRGGAAVAVVVDDDIVDDVDAAAGDDDRGCDGGTSNSNTYPYLKLTLKRS